MRGHERICECEFKHTCGVVVFGSVIVSECVAVCCSVLQCVAVCCSVLLQCVVAVCRRVL